MKTILFWQSALKRVVLGVLLGSVFAHGAWASNGTLAGANLLRLVPAVQCDDGPWKDFVSGIRFFDLYCKTLSFVVQDYAGRTVFAQTIQDAKRACTHTSVWGLSAPDGRFSLEHKCLNLDARSLGMTHP